MFACVSNFLSFVFLKGPYHDQLSFYMFQHSCCLVQKHIRSPNWIFDSPTIKQKLKFLALVRHVKVKWLSRTIKGTHNWLSGTLGGTQNWLSGIIVWIAYFDPTV